MSTTPKRGSAKLRLLALALALLLTGSQLMATTTEAINWDEFALLARTKMFLAEGQLQGGGRPGLAEIVLAPFARDCADAVSALRQARVLWLVLTASLLAGVYALSKRVRRVEGFDAASALAVALIAGIPHFTQWSLQVRTDHPAIVLAVWGGVALLASRARPALAAFAGFAIGLGGLFSQKTAYAAALGGLLAVIDLGLTPQAPEGPWRRHLGRRLLLLGAGVLAALGAYRVVLPLFVALPENVLPVERSLSLFAFYRYKFGLRMYRMMWPTLLPHLALLGLLLIATVRRHADALVRRSLAGGWAVCSLGVVVALFHAAAFPYFWITLALFPALATAVAFRGLKATMPNHRAATVFFGGLGAALAGQAFVASARLHEDTQAIQREALAFVGAAYSPEARGFQAEGALACRADPDPFPIFFPDRFPELFSAERKAQTLASLEAEFRMRPVAFMVGTHVFADFPVELRRFWSTHYVPYRSQVFVLGRSVSGAAGTVGAFEVLAEGRFRWWAPGDGKPSLAIGGQPLAPGAVVTLTKGVHHLQLLQQVEGGLLAHATEEPPARSKEFFYPRSQVDAWLFTP